MRLIRAGKVIFTDETAPELDQAPVLSRAESASMDAYSAGEARRQREMAHIEQETAKRVTFKHTEPKHIYSPAGHCMISREAPAYKEKGVRQGHWESAKIPGWRSPALCRPVNKGMGR